MSLASLRPCCIIAQDEKTSVVFGMPHEAIKLGAAEIVLPLASIIRHILKTRIY